MLKVSVFYRIDSPHVNGAGKWPRKMVQGSSSGKQLRDAAQGNNIK